MKKLLSFIAVSIQIVFKLFLRLILLLFSMLGLGSIYGLIDIYVNDSFSEAKFNAGLEKDCGVMPLEYDPAYGICWDNWQRAAGGGAGVWLIILILFLIIGIPSIIFLYKILKKDFIQLREKYKK